MAAYETKYEYSSFPIDVFLSLFKPPHNGLGFDRVMGELTSDCGSPEIIYHCDNNGRYFTSSKDIELIFKEGIVWRPGLIEIDAGGDRLIESEPYREAIRVVRTALNYDYLPKNSKSIRLLDSNQPRGNRVDFEIKSIDDYFEVSCIHSNQGKEIGSKIIQLMEQSSDVIPDSKSYRQLH